MRRKMHATLTVVFLSVLLFAVVSLNRFRDAIVGDHKRPAPVTFTTPSHSLNYAIRETSHHHTRRHVSSIDHPIAADSILFPAWEVLVVAAPDSSLLQDSGDEYTCVFQNNATSPAKPAWVLPFTNQRTFVCDLPRSVRRLRPFFQPVLTRSPAKLPEKRTPEPELIRWNFLVYESFSAAEDVVLFAKGVNNRQGINRPPSELRCVFSNGVDYAVKTAVTTSSQEVFRCHHPGKAALPIGGEECIKISLEIPEENRLVPSVAHYAPGRSPAIREEKALFCACTMVYNVAKFLREWVMYHSSIGIEKFILYDNGSDDDLQKVIEELVQEDYNVRKLLWPWPKTQEAGFSHCAMVASDSCTWMIYIDVDEFVFSPSWLNSSRPSKRMLKSLLPRTPLLRLSSSSFSSSSSGRLALPVGEILVQCYEFGPSYQQSHPVNGVTQGYTWRRRLEQRHKSIVLLDAIDGSLLNVIHHFHLKRGYRIKTLPMADAVVNHYKYQAWPEFKAKFRRRVSAYVVDWTETVNPMSKDRTPGLGFEPLEPKGWPWKFCEVRDDRLQMLTRRWFGLRTQSECKMAWQR